MVRGDRHLTAVLDRARSLGIEVRAEAGELHVKSRKRDLPTARLLLLAKAAVLAVLDGRWLPDGSCFRCGVQPDSLIPAYWGFPYCPDCCQHLGDFGGELDVKAAWPDRQALGAKRAVSPPVAPPSEEGGSL